MKDQMRCKHCSAPIIDIGTASGWWHYDGLETHKPCRTHTVAEPPEYEQFDAFLRAE